MGDPRRYSKDLARVAWGGAIVTAAGSSIFTSTDDGHGFVERGPIG
jgi:hypothetical protein